MALWIGPICTTTDRPSDVEKLMDIAAVTVWLWQWHVYNVHRPTALRWSITWSVRPSTN